MPLLRNVQKSKTYRVYEKMSTVFDMTEQERASQYLKKIPEGLHSIKTTANELEKTYKNCKKITTAGNMDLRAYQKVLCRIKKLTKQVEKNKGVL